MRDGRLGSRLLALALSHHGLRGIDHALRHGEPGIGFSELGREGFDVHMPDDLPGGDEIPFIHHFVGDTAGEFRGDIDLRRFHSAVAAGESVGQFCWLQ